MFSIVYAFTTIHFFLLVAFLSAGTGFWWVANTIEKSVIGAMSEKFIYKGLLGINVLVFILFCLAENLKPIHPYFALVFCASFIVAFLHWFHYAYMRNNINLGLIKIRGYYARLVILILSVFVAYRVLVTNYYIYPDTIEAKSKQERLSTNKAFELWLAARKDTLAPVYIIAGQGGGSRAGFWTANALLSLDSIKEGEFKQNIFAISTVSGSSVGALAALAYWNNGAKYQKSPSAYCESVFRSNYVTSSLAGSFFGDLLNKFIYIAKDRNQRLREEESNSIYWALNNVDDKDHFWSIFKKMPLDSFISYSAYHDIYYDEGKQLKTNLPYFLPNSTEVGSGRRAVVSPFKTDNFVNIVDVIGEEVALKQECRITLSSVANMSEAFPLLSATTTYLGHQYVDGGYFENYGLSTAYEIYEQCLPVAKRHRVKLYIISLINEKSGIPNSLYKLVGNNPYIFNPSFCAVQDSIKDNAKGQISALPSAIYNVHFGGYAEAIRQNVKQNLVSDSNYIEIAFDGNNVPLTRILTKSNVKDLKDGFRKQNLDFLNKR